MAAAAEAKADRRSSMTDLAERSVDRPIAHGDSPGGSCCPDMTAPTGSSDVLEATARITCPTDLAPSGGRCLLAERRLDEALPCASKCFYPNYAGSLSGGQLTAQTITLGVDDLDGTGHGQ